MLPAAQSVTRRSILHVLAPAPVGGLERVVRALAVGQAARGHRVMVLVILDEPGDTRMTSATADDRHWLLTDLAGTGVLVVPLVLGRYRYGQERAAVRALCRSTSIDIVHTHGRRTDVVDGGVARASGLPVVSTAHGFIGTGWRSRIHDLLQQRAHRRFNAVIAVSDPLRAELVRRGVREDRVHVIPNAYESGTPLLARPAARAALGLPDDALVVAWVGRLSREKGMDVLLAALPLLGDRPLVVAVLGAGRERAALEADAVARGVTGRVRWLGEVRDAARMYSAFDLFVLSSRTEGTPIALFEAMDAEVPIVATAVGGVPAVVTPAEALLVPADDPAALARAIGVAFDDPAAGRVRAAAAKARLKAKYSIGPWLDRHDALYASLAAGGARRSRSGGQS